MAVWSFPTLIAATLALSLNAKGERQFSLVSVPAAVVRLAYQTHEDSAAKSDSDWVEGASYDLRVTSLTPIPGSVREAFDTVVFTIANVGEDTSSDQVRLAVITRTISPATHVADTLVAARQMVPRIPPGGQVTLRVLVPRGRSTSMCYSGRIELPASELQ